MKIYWFKGRAYTLYADLLSAYHQAHGKYPNGPSRIWFNPTLLRYEEFY